MRIYRKYSGAGNTFLAFENFRGDFPLEKVPYLCRLHSVDGVILASSSEVGDFQMSYYNADGSFGAMCGNGLRCFAHFLRDLGLCLSLYQIEVGGNVLTVKCEESTISTFLPWPKLPQERVMVYTDELYKINTGVPHVVRFACEGVDVEEEGKRLRYHSLFEPDGVNANFVRIVDEKTLYVRTYERGVERERLSLVELELLHRQL